MWLVRLPYSVQLTKNFSVIHAYRTNKKYFIKCALITHSHSVTVFARSNAVAAPPDVLNEIVAALEY